MKEGHPQFVSRWTNSSRMLCCHIRYERQLAPMQPYRIDVNTGPWRIKAVYFTLLPYSSRCSASNNLKPKAVQQASSRVCKASRKRHSLRKKRWMKAPCPKPVYEISDVRRLRAHEQWLKRNVLILSWPNGNVLLWAGKYAFHSDSLATRWYVSIPLSSQCKEPDHFNWIT